MWAPSLPSTGRLLPSRPSRAHARVTPTSKLTRQCLLPSKTLLHGASRRNRERRRQISTAYTLPGPPSQGRRGNATKHVHPPQRGLPLPGTRWIHFQDNGGRACLPAPQVSVATSTRLEKALATSREIDHPKSGTRQN